MHHINSSWQSRQAELNILSSFRHKHICPCLCHAILLTKGKVFFHLGWKCLTLMVWYTWSFEDFLANFYCCHSYFSSVSFLCHFCLLSGFHLDTCCTRKNRLDNKQEHRHRQQSQSWHYFLVQFWSSICHTMLCFWEHNRVWARTGLTNNGCKSLM